MVARHPTWIIHRNMDGHIPYDMKFNTRARKMIQNRVPLSWSNWYYSNQWVQTSQQLNGKNLHLDLDAVLTMPSTGFSPAMGFYSKFFPNLYMFSK